MEKILHPATIRGTANYGWLQAKYLLNLIYYSDSKMTQNDMFQVFKDTFTDTLTKILCTGDHLWNWKTNRVSATSGNDNHVLLIEIPIQ